MPGNIEAKRAKLRQVFGGIFENVTLVPIDFERQDLGAILSSDGQRNVEKTFLRKGDDAKAGSIGGRLRVGR